MTIKEVYDRYKHLNKILSDNRRINHEDLKGIILFDLWQAIKVEIEFYKERDEYNRRRAKAK